MQAPEGTFKIDGFFDGGECFFHLQPPPPRVQNFSVRLGRFSPWVYCFDGTLGAYTVDPSDPSGVSFKFDIRPQSAVRKRFVVTWWLMKLLRRLRGGRHAS